MGALRRSAWRAQGLKARKPLFQPKNSIDASTGPLARRRNALLLTLGGHFAYFKVHGCRRESHDYTRRKRSINPRRPGDPVRKFTAPLLAAGRAFGRAAGRRRPARG